MLCVAAIMVFAFHTLNRFETRIAIAMPGNAPFKDLLEAFAEAAAEYAFQNHSDLGPLSLDNVDQIMVRERASNTPVQSESLVSCFGAWLGMCLVRGGGTWVGLDAPTPPRVEIAGVCYCPHDEITRQLNPAIPATDSLRRRVRTALEAPREAASPVEVDAANQAAWNALSSSQRFTSEAIPRLSLSEATAAIDPWLRGGAGQTSLVGKRLLCLAAGGGMHGCLHAMAGADVTLVDISMEQLKIDRQLASHLGLVLDTQQASLGDLSCLAGREFDVVLQPVSSCYIAALPQLYASLASLLVSGGTYVSQHKTPASLQVEFNGDRNTYELAHPSNASLPLPGLSRQSASYALATREPGTVEFLHSTETLVGGLCRAGFVIEDLQEPCQADAWAAPGSSSHLANYIPPYVKIKARKL